jgi:CRP-like cAMP-binding protein
LDQVCRVRGLIAPITHAARTMLFHERAPADPLFIFKTGSIKLTTALADGREQILRLALPEQMFGFESLNDSFYSYSACALTDVSVCAVRHRDMMRILEKDSDVSIRRCCAALTQHWPPAWIRSSLIGGNERHQRS